MNEELVQKINNSHKKAFFAITGGGQSFLGDYMKISGASKTVVGAIIPYSQHVFDKFIKKAKIDSYASEEAARKLAVAAFNECLDTKTATLYSIGIGVTCSLAKDVERAGREHRIHIAAHNEIITVARNIVLKQGRTRVEEEQIVSDLILDMLAYMVFPSYELTNPFILNKGETDVIEKSACGRATEIMIDFRPYDGNFDTSKDTLVFYSGSWNPLHDGHKEIIKLATEILGQAPILELALTNADKGQLDYIDINGRVKTMKDYPYVLTNAPTFDQKIELFRKHFPDKKLVFVMGADTWARLWDAKYAGDPAALEQKWDKYGVKFLVFGRNGFKFGNGFGENIGMRIKDARAENFSADISSTQIRKNQHANA